MKPVAAPREAGVPEFIDDWLDFRNREDGNQNFTAQILGGLQWLDLESNRLFQAGFAAATAISRNKSWTGSLGRHAPPQPTVPGPPSFPTFRDLTVSGFFSSKVGVADLHYLGNRPVAEWKGCDPKVWAIIEERMKNGYKGLGGEVKPILV